MNDTIKTAFSRGFKEEAESVNLPEEVSIGNTSVAAGAVGATGLPLAELAGVYQRYMPGTNLPRSAIKGGIGGLAAGTLGALGYNHIQEMNKSGMAKTASENKILRNVRRALTGKNKNPGQLRNISLGNIIGGGNEGTARAIEGSHDIVKDFDVVIGKGNARTRGAVMDEFDVFPEIKSYDNKRIRMENIPEELSQEDFKQAIDSASSDSASLSRGILENGLALQSDKGRAVIRDLNPGNIGVSDQGDKVVIDPIIDKVEGFYDARGAKGVFRDYVPSANITNAPANLLKRLGMRQMARGTDNAIAGLNDATRVGALGAAGYGLYDITQQGES